MHDLQVHDLLERAIGAGEPPVCPGILARAEAAARTARRRHRIASAVAVAAAAVLVPGAVLSVTNLTGGHSRPDPRPSGGPDPAVHGGPDWGFVRPELPPAAPVTDPAPETRQAFAQLLLDDLPAGATRSVVGEIQPHTVPQWAELALAPVATPTGQGNLDLTVTRPSPQNRHAVYCELGDACRLYRLPGGAVVVEEVSVNANLTAGSVYYGMKLYRPGHPLVTIGDYNYIAGQPLSARPPLTFAQLARIVLDPRWSFTMSKSFVDSARNLKVGLTTP